MKLSKYCQACGDPATCRHNKKSYCKECWAELHSGKIGPPPGPTEPAYHVGLCARQQASLRKMSS